MKNDIVRVTVTKVERTGYNRNGQPRCRVFWKFSRQTGSNMTASGAAFLVQGDPKPGEYDITVNGRDQIVNMVKVD